MKKKKIKKIEIHSGFHNSRSTRVGSKYLTASTTRDSSTEGLIIATEEHIELLELKVNELIEAVNKPK